MISKLYVIKDLIADESGPIFQAKSDEVAMRNFNNLIKDKSVNPDEYRLYCVGDYDNERLEGQFILEPIEITVGKLLKEDSNE